MLWCSLEPVAMETVASTVQSMPNRYLMSSAALRLTHGVTKQHASLLQSHTHTHSCSVLFYIFSQVFFFFPHLIDPRQSLDCCGLSEPEFDLTLHHVCRMFALRSADVSSPPSLHCGSTLCDWLKTGTWFVRCLSAQQHFFSWCSLLLSCGM